MLRKRTIAIAAFGIATIVVAGIFLWDYSKIGRHVPPMVAPSSAATHILIEKRERRMSLLRDGNIIKTYTVVLGSDPVGHKQMEGDGKTPEGNYAIDFKNPRSRFHLSMRISYPDANDRQRAHRDNVEPGGDIMIHGVPNGMAPVSALFRGQDWTDGCVAVTNAEIEEIWSLVKVGTTVEIRP